MSNLPHEAYVYTPPAAESPAPPVEQPAHVVAPAPTPEQVRTADVVFAHQEKESAEVQGFLGLWAGAMLLRDLAVDSIPAEEEDEEAAKEKPDPLGGHPSCC
jgi:hypothetical protein